MPAFQNLQNRRFGLLVAREMAPSKPGAVTWNCICDCGKETRARSSNLLSGNTRSCGCLKEIETIGDRTRKHGHSGGLGREYAAWKAMIVRCTNDRNPNWPKYGGRGIIVADVWRHDFPAFFAHIGPRPSPKHSVDRIDNDKGYEPGNVRWATKRVQALNQRPRKTIMVAGAPMRLRDAAAKFGLNQKTLSHRLWRGYSDEEAVQPSIRGRPWHKVTPLRSI